MTDETNSLTRLEEALGRLGAEHEPPEGWEDRVLDVVDKATDAADLADDRPDATATRPPDVLPWPGTGEAAPSHDGVPMAAHDGAPPEPIGERTTEATDVPARDAREAEAAQGAVDAVAAVQRDAREAVAAVHAQDPADAVAADAADAGVIAHFPGRSRRRWPMVAMDAVGMAAAGTCIVLGLLGPDFGGPAGQVELAVDVERIGPTQRSGNSSAHVGDVVHATAVGGAGHRALWVYHDDRLVLVCPGPHDCRDERDATIADVVLRAQGTYMFVAVTAAAELPVPRGKFDTDAAGANAAGVKIETKSVEAR
jgi:hypothetical protein